NNDALDESEPVILNLIDWKREIPDPLTRQRIALAEIEAARAEWKRRARTWAAARAEAVRELKQGRTWAEVAELLGVSEPTAWNIAHPKV
ncbi:MAG TPA: helix-turn-helix domain-containing protein, partial [Streptosporangiaceae bacterium]